MIQFEQMLQSSSTFVCGCFNIVNLYRDNIDGVGRARSTEAELGQTAAEE